MKYLAPLAAIALLTSPAMAQSVGEKTGINSTLGITPATEDFVKQAATTDMFEIQSSKLAGERGTMEASSAKLFATEALAKVVDCAVQIHGGMGYMRETGIETVYRDARIVRIYEGTSEIQRNIISGLLLKDD